MIIGFFNAVIILKREVPCGIMTIDTIAFDIVDKTIALMKLMKIIKEESGVLSLVNQLNEYIGIIKN